MRLPLEHLLYNHKIGGNGTNLFRIYTRVMEMTLTTTML